MKRFSRGSRFPLAYAMINSQPNYAGRKGQIMPRVKRYVKGNMMWSNTAYVDQWQKVMAVFDDRKNLRAVVKQIGDGAFYGGLEEIQQVIADHTVEQAFGNVRKAVTDHFAFR